LIIDVPPSCAGNGESLHPLLDPEHVIISPSYPFRNAADGKNPGLIDHITIEAAGKINNYWLISPDVLVSGPLAESRTKTYPTKRGIHVSGNRAVVSGKNMGIEQFGI